MKYQKKITYRDGPMFFFESSLRTDKGPLSDVDMMLFISALTTYVDQCNAGKKPGETMQYSATAAGMDGGIEGFDCVYRYEESTEEFKARLAQIEKRKAETEADKKKRREDNMKKRIKDLESEKIKLEKELEALKG